MAMYMYHFTIDGEYVDGVEVTGRQSNDNAFNQKLANTYQGCHAWALANEWHSIVAVALSFDRWKPEAESTVPECVRLAEYVRDKS